MRIYLRRFKMKRVYKIMVSKGLLYHTITTRKFQNKKEARQWAKKNYPSLYIKIERVR